MPSSPPLPAVKDLKMDDMFDDDDDDDDGWPDSSPVKDVASDAPSYASRDDSLVAMATR